MNQQLVAAAANSSSGAAATVTFTATACIARPAEAVFTFLMRCENNLLWQGGLEDVWQVTPGDVRLGTRLCEVRRFLGKRVSSEFEIIDFDPPRRCTTRAVRAPVPFEATYTLQAAGLSTVITAAGCVPHRALPRLAAHATRVLAQQELDGSLRRLKGVLEGDASGSVAQQEPPLVAAVTRGYSRRPTGPASHTV